MYVGSLNYNLKKNTVIIHMGTISISHMYDINNIAQVVNNLQMQFEEQKNRVELISKGKK